MRQAVSIARTRGEHESLGAILGFDQSTDRPIFISTRLSRRGAETRCFHPRRQEFVDAQQHDRVSYRVRLSTRESETAARRK